MKRVLIWNAHWNSVGGGELYALTLAKALMQAGYKVHIASLGLFPHQKIESTFGVTFPPHKIIEIGFENQLLDFLGENDIFINASYRSDFLSPAKTSIYICHFPSKLPIRKHLSLKMLNASSRKNFPVYLLGNQLFQLETVNKYFFNDLEVYFKNEDYNFLQSNKLGISKNLANTSSSLRNELDRKSHLIEHKILSSKRNPMSNLILQRLPKLTMSSYLLGEFFSPRTFLNNYKDVWVHSSFVERFLRKYWFRNPFIISPPVRLRKEELEGQRNPYGIVSVGRFFDPKGGHSKNQLLLVKAFAKLIAISDKPWKLHLVGTCSDNELDYLARVQAEVGNLDVEIHINARSEVLAKIYETNTFYWHAAGVNQPKRRPEKFEHFGISIVEAMNYGLIPLVYEVGGPAEILNLFKKMHYSKIGALPELTIKLLAEDLEKLSRTMFLQSLKYSERNFMKEAVARIELIDFESTD